MDVDIVSMYIVYIDTMFFVTLIVTVVVCVS